MSELCLMPRRDEVPPRAPLGVRRHEKRQAARLRIAQRTRRPLDRARPARDPWAPDRRSRARRTATAVAFVALSLGAHAGLLAVGLMRRAAVSHRPAAAQAVVVTVKPERERVAAPAPSLPQPEPPRRAARAMRPAPRPDVAPPVPATAPQPARVVGISLESTVEGGAGAAFAVGSTLAGATAERALAPPAPAPPAPANRVASHLPASGLTYTLPKRRHIHEPAYPETLKSQGVEADVVVMVELDAAGRVTAAKVVKGTAFPAFDEAARRAALSEEFEPATRAGLPIAYALTFTYHFRLENP